MFIANQMSSRRDGEDVSDLRDRPVVYTRATFNGGGTWQKIKVPGPRVPKSLGYPGDLRTDLNSTSAASARDQIPRLAPAPDHVGTC